MGSSTVFQGSCEFLKKNTRKVLLQARERKHFRCRGTKFPKITLEIYIDGSNCKKFLRKIVKVSIGFCSYVSCSAMS